MVNPESLQSNPNQQELSRELTAAESERIKKVTAQIGEILRQFNNVDLINITQEQYRKLDPETRRDLMRLSEKLERLVSGEKDFWPYESLTEEGIENSYQEFAKMYQSSGVIENGVISFEIEGEEKHYPLPTLEQIKDYLKKPEIEEKVEKLFELGLTKFWIVPICGVGDIKQAQRGEYTNPLVRAVATKLREKAHSNQLFYKDGKTNIKHFFDIAPIYFVDNYQNFGYRIHGSPRSLGLNERLKISSDSLEGWRLVMTEPNIAVKRNRGEDESYPLNELSTSQKYSDYAKIFNRVRFLTGLTPEDELTFYLYELTQEDRPSTVLHEEKTKDDGSSWLHGISTGLRSPACVRWYDELGRLYFDVNHPERSEKYLGVVPVAEI